MAPKYGIELHLRQIIFEQEDRSGGFDFDCDGDDGYNVGHGAVDGEKIDHSAGHPIVADTVV